MEIDAPAPSSSTRTSFLKMSVADFDVVQLKFSELNYDKDFPSECGLIFENIIFLRIQSSIFNLEPFNLELSM